MEFSYFFVCIKPNSSGGKFFKNPISLFDNAGKCPLSIKERCKFSLVCKKCRLVTFLDFNYRSSPPEVSLRKGVLKICSKFTGKQPCWSVISIKLLCLNFSMGILLEICRIFSEHLFLRAREKGCFCNYIIPNGLDYDKEYTNKKWKYINYILISQAWKVYLFKSY